MKQTLSEDLAHLAKLAFRRVEMCGDLVRRFHRLPPSASLHPDYALLQQTYAWVLAPLSLWPFDVGGLMNLLLARILAGQRAPEEARITLDLLGKAPSLREQERVAAYEHEARCGRYECFSSAQHKFDLREAFIARDPAFQADWKNLKRTFRAEQYRDEYGIIRRRMLKERNFRPEGWDFRWRTPDDRFRLAFEAFCHKWVLYGMEGDRPLLQKLSVNVTPLGTLVFIPRYWSFDCKRDLKWNAILRLHRTRDNQRQGRKLSASQLARQQEAIQAESLWQAAGAAGLKGSARQHWVMDQLGWDPRTDERQLRRLRQCLKHGFSIPPGSESRP